ncbi:PH domain-containing protein [Solidesulfovibrio sp.]|uniref:PH domain-containing protein n=1 Tax=Solidesulfovibrio sp. TaxID=2910990 RepID=UPI00261DACED|nr:PH domain-containing protein [Solidesulfovibrio sp.]
MEWGEVFPMAASAVKTGWLTALFGGMLVLWVGLFFFLNHMIRGAAEAEIALRGGNLVVRGAFYGREIPLAEVDVDGAVPSDLGHGGPKSLKWRTNGIGMPGLAAGWYKLGDGEKALVFVTDKTRAVYVPTRLGYAVVVSPGDPDRFLAALRRAAARAAADPPPAGRPGANLPTS